MKKQLALIGNILIILIGLLGLGAPYITDGIIAIGLGGFLDVALLQPLFIAVVIVAIVGQVYLVKESLNFLAILLQFIIGIVAFLFIFPLKNEIVGYGSLIGILYLAVWPFINKKLQKRKVVKIKI